MRIGFGVNMNQVKDLFAITYLALTISYLGTIG